MCGRFTLAAPADELVEAFDIGDLTFEYFARYNVAPGQEILVVAEDRKGRRAGRLTWGLVPGWSDGTGRPFVNARAETIDSKPSFREAFDRRRCLVPADGFYEWRRPEDGKGGAAKVPYWFHPTSGGTVAFAGIWERWRRPGASPLHTVALLTSEANADVSEVHHRMPVVISRDDHARWLSPTVPGRDVGDVLGPAPAGTFERHAVDSRVNRVGEDDVGLIAPLAERA
ncbi:MAG: SOS response-associated peptidase [Gemmatimonadota bacterium]